MARCGWREVTLYTGKVANISNKMVPIDPQKFRSIVSARELNMAKMSRDMGFAPSSVSSRLASGYMNKQMVFLLNKFFNIRQEDIEYIAPAKEPKEEPKKEPPATPLTEQTLLLPEKDESKEMAALYNIVRAAVLDAINEGVAGNMKNLRGCMYTAIYTAINAAKKGE